VYATQLRRGSTQKIFQLGLVGGQDLFKQVIRQQKLIQVAEHPPQIGGQQRVHIVVPADQLAHAGIAEKLVIPHAELGEVIIQAFAVLRILGGGNGSAAAVADQQAGNGKIALDHKHRAPGSRGAAKQLEMNMAEVGQHVNNERGIIDGVPFFAADIDHQLEIDVIIATLVHQLAVLQVGNFQAVFARHFHQVHHSHNVQLADAAQHRVDHFGQILQHVQLGPKVRIGANARLAAVQFLLQIIIFSNQVIINGGFQVTGDANAVFPQQQVTAIIGGFIHHAGTDALHHALFSLFGRQHAAADPFADIGNIVLQALGQGIVLDLRNFQQMLQQNAESIFIIHCTKSSSPI